MVSLIGIIVLCAATAGAIPATDAGLLGEIQQPLLQVPQAQSYGSSRKLKGKILHITDLHPDPYYKIGSPPAGDHPCHEGSSSVETGFYGAPGTSCDSPFTLIEATFKWIKEHVKDEVDFIIWTGDSARHDNDDHVPRSARQIAQLNRFVFDKFVQTFGKTSRDPNDDSTNNFIVPIIPTIGNNDILPHNIFMPGPNAWTRTFLNIWSDLIPEEQKHSFARGGWFWTEVIPNSLAVVSLNTLYFFEKNSATFGCDIPSEPGYEQMEWLRIQLQFMRERGLKVLISGHIPPARTESKQAWDESCYQKYILWQRQYRDVIVANLFGHMNIDHFMFHDIEDLVYKIDADGMGDTYNHLVGNNAAQMRAGKIHATAQTDYLNELRLQWNDLPIPPKGISYSTDHTLFTTKKKRRKQLKKFLDEIGGPYGERFSMSIAAPSVVPNYFPSLRIIEYNISGLKHDHTALQSPAKDLGATRDLDFSQTLGQCSMNITPIVSKPASIFDLLEPLKKKKHKKKKKNKKQRKRPDFPIPIPPAKASPPGPAYSPQTFSLLSWTQLYANLTSIHEQMTANTLPPSHLDGDTSHKRGDIFGYEIEYATNDGTYGLSDLTIRNWLGLATKIGQTVYRTGGEAVEISGHDIVHEVADDVSLRDKSVCQQTVRDGTGEPREQKHKGKKSHGKLKDNCLWHEFIKRAFVSARNDTYLEAEFG